MNRIIIVLIGIIVQSCASMQVRELTTNKVVYQINSNGHQDYEDAKAEHIEIMQELSLLMRSICFEVYENGSIHLFYSEGNPHNEKKEELIFLDEAGVIIVERGYYLVKNRKRIVQRNKIETAQIKNIENYLYTIILNRYNKKGMGEIQIFGPVIINAKEKRVSSFFGVSFKLL